MMFITLAQSARSAWNEHLPVRSFFANKMRLNAH